MSEGNESHAFYRSTTGELTDIGTLGGSRSIATDINNLGAIVGTAKNSSGFSEAFFYTVGSGLQALGTLGGPTSIAQSINDNAMIVGSSTSEDFAQHAALFDLAGLPVDLAPNWAQSGASDVNNANQVVGFVTDTPNQDFQAALFSSTGGQPELLEDLIPLGSGWDVLGAAAAINNSGQILGLGVLQGSPTIFILTPVPEPSTLALLLCSSLMLLYRGTKVSGRFAREGRFARVSQ